jgi:hypothetical protein
MKKTAIALSLLALLATGCSTNKNLLKTEDTDVKEQRLATDFTRQGIRVTYTFGGDVEKIEAYGYADVWRGQYRTVAEADAKDKLIKFLRGETVDSQKMTRVIAKSIERSQDNMLNKTKTVDGTIVVQDTDIENESQSQPQASNDENSKENTALRKASVNNAQIVTSTVLVSSRGRLNAVYKEKGYSADDGKTYTVVYAWSPKMQRSARYISTMMDAK